MRLKDELLSASFRCWSTPVPCMGSQGRDARCLRSSWGSVLGARTGLLQDSVCEVTEKLLWEV